MLRTALLSALVLSNASVPVQSPSEAPSPANLPAQIALCRDHYARVEEELARADVSNLSPERIEARARLIQSLEAYRERGDFGRNLDYPGARMPYFVDAGGRRCAVAELLHVSGERRLVETVRARDNHAWIVDLAGDPTFESWLERNGMTIEEAARIQVPVGGDTRGFDGGPGSRPIVPPRSSGGSYSGPGDSVGGSGSGSRPSGSGPASGNPTPSSPATAAPGAKAPGSTSPPPGVPTIVNLTTESDDGWWLWWEYNKVEFIRPNRLGIWGFPTTGNHESSFLERTASTRRSLRPILLSALTDEDATVRAAAALSLGRIEPGASTEHLVKALSDPSLEVRHKAILALGSSGSAGAVLPLLAIARHGSAEGETGARISRAASPLAIVALALGRRAGFDERIDGEIASLALDARRSDRDDVATAAMIYQVLSPCPELAAAAVRIASDGSRSPGLRCRAIESLRTASDERTLSKLQGFLSGPRLDMRRSAALALGGFDHPLALPPLMTAFELEAEPLTRGFILVSIGRRGGPQAQEFLTRASLDAGVGMRKWSVLALGILARRTVDDDTPALRKTIREAAEREKNRDAAPAYWIASGLARDEMARPTLRDALAHASDPRARMYAATALGLLDGDASIAALRERMGREQSSLVRSAIAGALGAAGRAEDAPALFAALQGLREPQLQSFASLALAFHGTHESFMALNEMVRAKSGGNVRRAAAIESIGMLLADSPPLALGEVSRQANYTVFNDWVKELFQVTL